MTWARRRTSFVFVTARNFPSLLAELRTESRLLRWRRKILRQNFVLSEKTFCWNAFDSTSVPPLASCVEAEPSRSSVTCLYFNPYAAAKLRGDGECSCVERGSESRKLLTQRHRGAERKDAEDRGEEKGRRAGKDSSSENASYIRRLFGRRRSLCSWNIEFGVVGGTQENNYYGEIHPDHYTDGGGQAAVN
jgi:hypothetical protein